MALDPSIPLKGLLINRNDELLKQEQIANARAARQAHQLKQQERQAEREAYRGVFSGMANGQRPSLGDLAPLGSINPEAALKIYEHFGKLDETTRKLEADKWKAAGPVLARLKTVPLEQRGAFMQSALPSLGAAGWTPQELANVDLSDDSIEALSATAMTVDQVLDSQKLNWHPIGENGSFATDNLGNPVGSGNPFAPKAAPSSPAPSGGDGNIGANNNPGALRIPGSKQFQRFASVGDGIQAQEALLGRYVGHGVNTVSSVVEKYAPRESRGGDNTDGQVNNYIGYVAQRLGIDQNAPINPQQIGQLASAMREFETGNRGSGAKPAKDKGQILREANDAIKRGADPEKVKARLRELGVL